MNRPLRFCMITTFYPPYNFGGDGIFVHRLANELASRGHRVEVIHCIDSYRLLAGKNPAEGYDDHPGITIHGLHNAFGRLSSVITQQTGQPLCNAARIKAILEKGFDVIHYHNISLVGGPKILEYGSGIKLYTIHEYWLVCATHLLYRFNRAPCTHRSCLLCTLACLRPPQWWRLTGLLQRAIRHVDAFIAPSQYCKELHQRLLPVDIPVVHLQNFVPREELLPEPGSGAAAAEPFFLFVGRLEKVKGLETILPLFRQYRRAGLLIAGTGTDEARLRRLAGDSSTIRFLGHLTSGQLQPLYRQAQAVIVPSVCYEISGTVIFEAFRQATPVIVRNLGGMPESVVQSGGGFVYDTDAQLLAAMEQLLADPVRRRTLGRLGYQAYLKYWSADSHCSRYLSLIDEKIGQNVRRGKSAAP